MGRVRSYKKIKAIDPFSKRGKTVSDTVHDEPPDLYEQRVKNSKKRKQYDWDDEAQRELILQREAMRNLKASEVKQIKKDANKIEPQKEGESLREFKKRVREGTKKTLTEELSKMTSTAKRRKEKLKERKLAKKNKGKKDEYEEEVMEFSMSSDGRLRPSDLGQSSSSFAKSESFKFGERADRPPDLKQFASKLEQRKQSHDKPRRQAEQSESDGEGSEEDESEEEEVSRRKKKQKVQHIMDRLDMEGDDGLETATGVKGKAGIIHAGSHRQALASGAGGKKGPSTASTKNANFAEMEKIRARVQEAYNAVRDKRRADSARAFNSSNRG